jgi:arylsulfatase
VLLVFQCQEPNAGFARGSAGKTGGPAVDTHIGWKGPDQYVATVPQVFDLWHDPKERYDIFMNNYTEHIWDLVAINAAVKDLMQTYVKYPPRQLQSEPYTGPITLSEYERFQFLRDALGKNGFQRPLPTGN